MIAKGDMFGHDQPVILQLLDIEPCLPILNGVVMELEDCAFPLLKSKCGIFAVKLWLKVVSCFFSVIVVQHPNYGEVVL